LRRIVKLVLYFPGRIVPNAGMKALIGMLTLVLFATILPAADSLRTRVEIVGTDFHINGAPTYPGREWNGHRIEGLLMNSRMVQGVFDDLNPETVGRWAYPDTGKWDAERNVREFIEAIPLWRQHGLLAVTVNFQGGSPEGYSNTQPWDTGAFDADGTLRPAFADRMARILTAADRHGMVVILGYFYFGQDERLKDEAAVIRATENATNWVLDGGWRNVLIEINNETNVAKYDHEILKPRRVSELIERVKGITRDGRRLLVGTSYGGGAIPGENVVRASDFLLIHGNGVHDPARITRMVRQTRAVPGYRPMPVVFNEDDHEGFDQPTHNFGAAVAEHASWGWFDYRRKGEAFTDGYQSPPVDWGINSPRKQAFFAKCAEITGAPKIAAPPPNIVVMLIDDMGVMDTSLPFLTDDDGKPVRHPLNDFYRTPNLERLAKMGVRFNQFNAMSVCSPTRRTLMTGQHAARHGTTNWINAPANNRGKFGPPDWNWSGLRSSDVTLPGLLRTTGYRTIHLGKAHFAADGIDGADPTKIGFDVNIGGGTMGQPGSYYGRSNFSGSGPQRDRFAVPGLAKYHGQDIFLTEALTREALAEIDRAAADQVPFFLHFSHYAVHSPFQSDPRFAGHYKDSGKPPPAQAYATLIEGIDKSLGDLLDHLEKLNIAENTLIIFLGDNGGDAPLGGAEEVASSAPLRGKKGSCYEGGVRVPFIASWGAANPENPMQQRLPIAANSIQTQLASVEDVFPTLLNLTNTAVPAGHRVDGRPLDSLLTGKPDPSRPEAFLMHYPHDHRTSYWSSFRDGEWKIIHRYGPPDGPHVRELYHLKSDPFEQTDLAASRPAELAAMTAKLIAALEDHDAAYPVTADGATPLKPDP